jgi:hypothetical protein
MVPANATRGYLHRTSAAIRKMINKTVPAMFYNGVTMASKWLFTAREGNRHFKQLSKTICADVNTLQEAPFPVIPSIVSSVEAERNAPLIWLRKSQH